MGVRVLVTGVAGFIGFHLAKGLMDRGYEVVGIDNLNAYYDVQLKQDRLNILRQDPTFLFEKSDLRDAQALAKLFESQQFDYVVNLAAQAGVRHSISHPQDYVDANLIGFMNLLEACRAYPVKHLIYASSSSVYGGNKQLPFSTSQMVDCPISLYAATKKSNELMAHAYSHLYGIPTTGLRFFTVYGPWGRPDMACFLFARNILEGKPIDVYNYGNMSRDFTYVADVVEAICRLLPHTPTGVLGPYAIYNVGNHQPVSLAYMIEVIEKYLGIKAQKNYMPLQPGDVVSTYADIAPLEAVIQFRPQTPIEEGIKAFVTWYLAYYQV